LTFIVDGVDAVSSFIVLSKIRWNMVVPPDNTTLTCNSLRSHSMKQRKEVSWTPQACLPVKFDWNNTSTQTETFGAINDDVFVSELEGLEGPYRELALEWSNHLDLTVDEANAVSSFVMCSKIHWNMVVPPGNMT